MKLPIRTHILIRNTSTNQFLDDSFNWMDRENAHFFTHYDALNQLKEKFGPKWYLHAELVLPERREFLAFIGSKGGSHLTRKKRLQLLNASKRARPGRRSPEAAKRRQIRLRKKLAIMKGLTNE